MSQVYSELEFHSWRLSFSQTLPPIFQENDLFIHAKCNQKLTLLQTTTAVSPATPVQGTTIASLESCTNFLAGLPATILALSSSQGDPFKI